MINGPGSNGFDYSFTAMKGIQAGPYAYFENDVLHGDPSATDHLAGRVTMAIPKFLRKGLGFPPGILDT